jgi:carboxypeptidase C (cathepsin A)
VAQSLALTPGLRLLVVQGRTDLVTPYMASRWLLDRLDLPDDVRSRVDLTVLDGGHMMYLAADQRRALSERAAEFYRR